MRSIRDHQGRASNRGNMGDTRKASSQLGRDDLLSTRTLIFHFITYEHYGKASMLKIKIKSGSQQNNSHHYSNDGYDDYGEYVGHNQGYQDTEPSQSECSICGGNISGSHLVFSLKNSDHEVHTSCLITSVALISNGIAIVASFFKRKKPKRKQLKKGG